MIDNQEKETSGPSVLYLNNRKIQSAKNNQNVTKAFEIFADFLNCYQLQNTKEIFASEANYKVDSKVSEELKTQFKEKDVSVGVQLLRKVKRNGLSKKKPEQKEQVPVQVQEKKPVKEDIRL